MYDETCSDGQDRHGVEDKGKYEEDLANGGQARESMRCGSEEQTNSCGGQWESEPGPCETVRIQSIQAWRNQYSMLTARGAL